MSRSNKRKEEYKPSDDIGWKFGTVAGNRHTIKCNLCGKQISGGITRVKEHLAHKKGNVAGCPQVPVDVKRDMMKLLMDHEFNKKAKEKRSRKLERGFIRMCSTSNQDKDDNPDVCTHRKYIDYCSRRDSEVRLLQPVQHQQQGLLLGYEPAGPSSGMVPQGPKPVSKEAACIQSEPFFPTYPSNVVEYVSSSGVFSTKPIKYPEQVPSFRIPTTFRNWKEALQDCVVKISGLKEMLRQAWEDIKCLTKERDVYKAKTDELKAKVKELELLSNLVSLSSGPPASGITSTPADIPSNGCGSSHRLRPNPLPRYIHTRDETTEEEEELDLLNDWGKNKAKLGKRKRENEEEEEEEEKGEVGVGAQEDEDYEEDGDDKTKEYVDDEEEAHEEAEESEDDEAEEEEEEEEEEGDGHEGELAELRSKRCEDRSALGKKKKRCR